MMQAVQITKFGGPEVLQLVERPVPEIMPDEVLIEVQAAGVSRPDVLQRQGSYPPPTGAPDIPGLEVAGVIAKVGKDVTTRFVGERVCALVSGGGYAAFCAAPALQVLPMPTGWSATESATLPENLFTVYDMLVMRLDLRGRETVLIHGGSSGIGSTAIMLARLIGALPVATAGSDEKCAAARKIGAELAINYKSQDFVAEVRQYTDGIGVDVILDIVGGDYVARDIAAIAADGRIGLLAMQGGSTATIPINDVIRKRVTIRGASMRSRSAEQKGLVAASLLENIWPRLEAKDPFRPLVDVTFPLHEASLAHTRMEAGEHVGKIVLVAG